MYFLKEIEDCLDIPGFPWKKLIVSFILAQYIFEQFLVLRQYKKLKEKKPSPALENIVDLETYNKSQEYGRAKAKFGLVAEMYELVQKLLIISYDILPKLYGFVQLQVDQFFPEKFSGEVKI